jgi:adenine nucleotide transporter 17
MDQVFTYDAFVHAIAGTVGGQVATTTFYPLDVVRTCMQVESKYKGKNFLKVAKMLVEEEGILSLYKGIGPGLLALAASNFVYFYTNNMLKALVKSYTGKRNVSTAQNLLIASAAGCVNVMTTCPLWVVSNRLKTQKNRDKEGYKGVLDGLIRIANEEGITALWNGCVASLILVSNPTIQFVVYDAMRKMAMVRANKSGRKTLSTWEFFLLGAIAKAISTVATYPLQVAQSKLRNSKKNLKEVGHSNKLHKSQAENEAKGNSEPKDSSQNPTYENTLDCLIKIFQKDGFFGWYAGLDAKLLQTVLMAAFHFLTYEKIVALIFAIMKKNNNVKSKVSSH